MERRTWATRRRVIRLWVSPATGEPAIGNHLSPNIADRAAIVQHRAHD